VTTKRRIKYADQRLSRLEKRIEKPMCLEKLLPDHFG